MNHSSTCCLKEKGAISNTHLKSQFKDLDDDPAEIQCLLCEEKFILPSTDKTFWNHLFVSHHLVIADIDKICSLKSYIHYWRTKFRDDPVQNFCSTMMMPCTPDGTETEGQEYFLLSDCLPEDKTLRDELHKAKLEWLLSVQEHERTDTTFKRGCMFCKAELSGSRHAYLNHLSERHNVQLGRPGNLVFIDKFLDKIEENIQKLLCIYCEKTFISRLVLREHMRKKMHKRVNPNNHFYDQFYVINYLKPRSIFSLMNKDETNENGDSNLGTKEDVDDDDDDETINDDYEDNIDFDKVECDDDWDDWNGESISIACLFCEYSNTEFKNVLSHMNKDHDFDFEQISKDMDFYEKIKVVNFIRFQMLTFECIFCNDKFEDRESLIRHMKEYKHFKLSMEMKLWQNPEFYFSLFNKDSFLYLMDSDDNLLEGNINGILNSFADNTRL